MFKAHLSLALPLAIGLAASPLAADEPRRMGAHGLMLPGSFTGVLPCADCPGIRHHLDLHPATGGYALRVEYIDREVVSDELGLWHVDPLRRALVLQGPGDARQEWQILGNGNLRLLDPEGQPIDSALPYELEPGPLAPLDISGPMTGMFVYFADAALFTECLTGQRFPVMMEADYLALETAYLDARTAPAAPLLARLEGRVAEREMMEGPARPALTVERFHHVTPYGACNHQRAAAGLENTFWRLVRLDGTALPAAADWREPYLLLGVEGEARFAATAGCNTMIGGYTLDGEALSFGPAASTMMGCPEPLDALEAALGAALEGTASVTSDGFRLELRDASGTALAEFEADYGPH